VYRQLVFYKLYAHLLIHIISYNPKYIIKFSSYREVNILRLGYKNQSVNGVAGKKITVLRYVQNKKKILWAERLLFKY